MDSGIIITVVVVLDFVVGLSGSASLNDVVGFFRVVRSLIKLSRYLIVPHLSSHDY